MWHPTRLQWAIIWPVALVVVLGWPPAAGKSLAMHAINWAADPWEQLPTMPPPLPRGRDDDGDAVTEHDMLENAYLDARARSTSNRIRMDLKSAGDPLAPSTQRQVLVGLAVLGGLLVWQIDTRRR